MSRSLTNNRGANMAFLLVRAFRWFELGVAADPKLRKFPDLSVSQILLLANLDTGGTRVSDLARQLRISRQAAHQAVRELTSMGVLEIADDPRDRRAKLVRLSHQGRALDRRAVDAFWRLEEELKRRVGAETSRSLRRALEADWGPPVSSGANEQ